MKRNNSNFQKKHFRLFGLFFPKLAPEKKTKQNKKLLFDKTITQGKLPSQWKIAEVRPIFKKGIKTSPGNYRPVSLTPIICKVFEGFIKDSIFKHLIHNNLLSDD